MSTPKRPHGNDEDDRVAEIMNNASNAIAQRDAELDKDTIHQLIKAVNDETFATDSALEAASEKGDIPGFYIAVLSKHDKLLRLFLLQFKQQYSGIRLSLEEDGGNTEAVENLVNRRRAIIESIQGRFGEYVANALDEISKMFVNQTELIESIANSVKEGKSKQDYAMAYMESIHYRQKLNTLMLILTNAATNLGLDTSRFDTYIDIATSLNEEPFSTNLQSELDMTYEQYHQFASEMEGLVDVYKKALNDVSARLSGVAAAFVKQAEAVRQVELKISSVYNRDGTKRSKLGVFNTPRATVPPIQEGNMQQVQPDPMMVSTPFTTQPPDAPVQKSAPVHVQEKTPMRKRSQLPDEGVKVAPKAVRVEEDDNPVNTSQPVTSTASKQTVKPKKGDNATLKVKKGDNATPKREKGDDTTPKGKKKRQAAEPAEKPVAPPVANEEEEEEAFVAPPRVEAGNILLSEFQQLTGKGALCTYKAIETRIERDYPNQTGMLKMLLEQIGKEFSGALSGDAQAFVERIRAKEKEWIMKGELFFIYFLAVLRNLRKDYSQPTWLSSLHARWDSRFIVWTAFKSGRELVAFDDHVTLIDFSRVNKHIAFKFLGYFQKRYKKLANRREQETYTERVFGGLLEWHYHKHHTYYKAGAITDLFIALSERLAMLEQTKDVYLAVLFNKLVEGELMDGELALGRNISSCIFGDLKPEGMLTAVDYYDHSMRVLAATNSGEGDPILKEHLATIYEGREIGSIVEKIGNRGENVWKNNTFVTDISREILCLRLYAKRRVVFEFYANYDEYYRLGAKDKEYDRKHAGDAYVASYMYEQYNSFVWPSNLRGFIESLPGRRPESSDMDDAYTIKVTAANMVFEPWLHQQRMVMGYFPERYIQIVGEALRGMVAHESDEYREYAGLPVITRTELPYRDPMKVNPNDSNLTLVFYPHSRAAHDDYWLCFSISKKQGYDNAEDLAKFIEKRRNANKRVLGNVSNDDNYYLWLGENDYNTESINWLTKMLLKSKDDLSIEMLKSREAGWNTIVNDDVVLANLTGRMRDALSNITPYNYIDVVKSAYRALVEYSLREKERQQSIPMTSPPVAHPTSQGSAPPVANPATKSVAPPVPSHPVVQSSAPPVPNRPVVQPKGQTFAPVVPPRPAVQTVGQGYAPQGQPPQFVPMHPPVAAVQASGASSQDPEDATMENETSNPGVVPMVVENPLQPQVPIQSGLQPPFTQANKDVQMKTEDPLVAPPVPLVPHLVSPPLVAPPLVAPPVPLVAPPANPVSFGNKDDNMEEEELETAVPGMPAVTGRPAAPPTGSIRPQVNQQSKHPAPPVSQAQTSKGQPPASVAPPVTPQASGDGNQPQKANSDGPSVNSPGGEGNPGGGNQPPGGGGKPPSGDKGEDSSSDSSSSDDSSSDDSSSDDEEGKMDSENAKNTGAPEPSGIKPPAPPRQPASAPASAPPAQPPVPGSAPPVPSAQPPVPSAPGSAPAKPPATVPSAPGSAPSAPPVPPAQPPVPSARPPANNEGDNSKSKEESESKRVRSAEDRLPQGDPELERLLKQVQDTKDMTAKAKEKANKAREEKNKADRKLEEERLKGDNTVEGKARMMLAEAEQSKRNAEVMLMEGYVALCEQAEMLAERELDLYLKYKETGSEKRNDPGLSATDGEALKLGQTIARDLQTIKSLIGNPPLRRGALHGGHIPDPPPKYHALSKFLPRILPGDLDRGDGTHAKPNPGDFNAYMDSLLKHGDFSPVPQHLSAELNDAVIRVRNSLTDNKSNVFRPINSSIYQSVENPWDMLLLTALDEIREFRGYSEDDFANFIEEWIAASPLFDLYYRYVSALMPPLAALFRDDFWNSTKVTGGATVIYSNSMDTYLKYVTEGEGKTYLMKPSGSDHIPYIWYDVLMVLRKEDKEHAEWYDASTVIDEKTPQRNIKAYEIARNRIYDKPEPIAYLSAVATGKLLFGTGDIVTLRNKYPGIKLANIQAPLSPTPQSESSIKVIFHRIWLGTKNIEYTKNVLLRVSKQRELAAEQLREWCDYMITHVLPQAKSTAMIESIRKNLTIVREFSNGESVIKYWELVLGTFREHWVTFVALLGLSRQQEASFEKRYPVENGPTAELTRFVLWSFSKKGNMVRQSEHAATGIGSEGLAPNSEGETDSDDDDHDDHDYQGERFAFTGVKSRDEERRDQRNSNTGERVKKNSVKRTIKTAREAAMGNRGSFVPPPVSRHPLPTGDQQGTPGSMPPVRPVASEADEPSAPPPSTGVPLGGPPGGMPTAKAVPLAPPLPGGVFPTVLGMPDPAYETVFSMLSQILQNQQVPPFSASAPTKPDSSEGAYPSSIGILMSKWAALLEKMKRTDFDLKFRTERVEFMSDLKDPSKWGFDLLEDFVEFLFKLAEALPSDKGLIAAKLAPLIGTGKSIINASMGKKVPQRDQKNKDKIVRILKRTAYSSTYDANLNNAESKRIAVARAKEEARLKKKMAERTEPINKRAAAAVDGEEEEEEEVEEVSDAEVYLTDEQALYAVQMLIDGADMIATSYDQYMNEHGNKIRMVEAFEAAKGNIIQKGMHDIQKELKQLQGDHVNLLTKTRSKIKEEVLECIRAVRYYSHKTADVHNHWVKEMISALPVLGKGKRLLNDSAGDDGLYSDDYATADDVGMHEDIAFESLEIPRLYEKIRGLNISKYVPLKCNDCGTRVVDMIKEELKAKADTREPTIVFLCNRHRRQVLMSGMEPSMMVKFKHSRHSIAFFD